MGKYIVGNFSKVDEKIEQDLTIIINRLLEVYKKNISAIFLCGGFGRKEGSIIKTNGDLKPFNDYDLLLVTKKRISKNKLNKLGEELAKIINIRFVDLGAIKESSLLEIPNTIFSFDLKNSMVIYGDKKTLDKIPIYDAKKLPTDEGSKILLNRLICFIELTPDGFFSKIPLNDIDHRALVIQTSKPVIATTICILVNKGLYDTSYAQQLQNFLKLDASDKIKNLVSLSYQLKLGLQDPIDIDALQYWYDAKDFFIETFERYIKGDQSWDIFFKTHTVNKLDIYKLLKNLAKYLFYHEQPENETLKRKAEIIALRLILSNDAGNWDINKKEVVKFWFEHHH